MKTISESYPLDNTSLIRIIFKDGETVDVEESEVIRYISDLSLNVEVYTERGNYLGYSPYTGDEWEDNEKLVATDPYQYLDENWDEVIPAFVAENIQTCISI